ncbi:ABC transporter permease [Flaviaesturariibacter aridisoli]|uniref:ABC transporter permease n=1 Tax=Flaviaesturariibacter aridisoli TaxID=2545761 RepID=A0A4R4DZM6_9BACT|nr:ABC transporter permease [Flaviaesturariibacter aridisoli]TCZ67920.1 ABC transporter permease [Flaviaesturariibacter aridisoli]
MSKVGIIIRREYISRVRKKTFILTTLLTPLFFVALITIVTIITINSTRKESVAVIDPSGMLRESLTSSEAISYNFNAQVDTSNFEKDFSAVVFAPHTGINRGDGYQVVSQKSLSRIAHDKLERDIYRAVENHLISQQLQVDPKRIDSLKEVASKTVVQQVKKSDLAKNAESNFGVGMAVGYVTAFLIYITLFIYGVMVMRGVMEEKTSKVAEVIVSSVRPFELMMGKILGIGAVGLTQFLIWIVLIVGIMFAASAFLPSEMLHHAQQASQQMPGAMQQGNEAAQAFAKAQNVLGSVNWPLVIGCFLFYFIGGYLFYAALFAAVGSTVNEDPADAQSLTLPVTMPIIVAIIIMINSINDPSSTLATWASLIPFTSPIVMMSRIPFGVPDTVPYWQLALSMLLLVGGFLGTTWLSARIYRTGILLYGKKPTWKEMMKWARK